MPPTGTRPGLALGVLLLAACSAPPPPAAEATPPPAAPARPPVVHLSIPDKVAEGEGRFKADWSFDLRAGDPRFSVHVHVIPPGQIIPLHHHPENAELVAIAAGTGEWEGLVADGGGLRAVATPLPTGSLVLSRATCPHGVRNRGSEPLATVVVHEPEFGQNWYLDAEELPPSTCPTEVLSDDADVPRDLFAGLRVERLRPEAPIESDGAEETLYLGLSGGGSLRFEDKALPLAAGSFSRLPAGLAHRVEPSDGLTLLRLALPPGGP